MCVGDMVDVGHGGRRRLRYGGGRALRHVRGSARHALSLRRLAIRTRHTIGCSHLLWETMGTTRAGRYTRIVYGLLEPEALTIVPVVHVVTLGWHSVHTLIR